MTTSISSIAKARYEFEISITNFESCKSAVEKLLDPAIKVKKETLIASRKAFETALKDLNKCHTIWMCKSEDIGVDVSEDYSTSWLEKVWHHHCDLDDELDELIYTFDDSSVT